MRYLLFSFFLVGFLNANAQDVSVYDQKRAFYKVSPGLWIPIGKLQKTFNNSPMLGFAVEVHDEYYRMEFSVDFIIINKHQSFEYADADTSFVTGEQLNIESIGLKIGKLTKMRPNVFFEKSLGIGYSFLSTGVKSVKPDCVGFVDPDGWHIVDKNCGGENKYKNYYIESFYLSAGLGLQKAIFKRRILSVHAGYRFTPYSWFKNVDKSFGNSALSTSISFGF